MYEIWDRESGNQIGEYGSEAHALDAVRRLADQLGPTSVGSLVLAVYSQAGEPVALAHGEELLRRAEAERPRGGRSLADRIRHLRPLGFLRGVVPIDAAHSHSKPPA